MRLIKTVECFLGDNLKHRSSLDYWASEALPHILLRVDHTDSSVEAFLGVVILDAIKSDLISKTLLGLAEKYSTRHISSRDQSLFLVSLVLEIPWIDIEKYFTVISQYFTTCQEALTTILNGVRVRPLMAEELARQVN